MGFELRRVQPLGCQIHLAEMAIAVLCTPYFQQNEFFPMCRWSIQLESCEKGLGRQIHLMVYCKMWLIVQRIFGYCIFIVKRN
jgi:hypothetical protein